MITPKELILFAKKRGLNAVAVTDHNRVEGALKIAKQTPDFLIIPGIEVSSADGHIVGLNLREVIPRGLSAEVTVEKIHDAGGVAVACHPYALFKGSLGKNVSAKFDAIETLNARAFPFHRSRRKAEQAAVQFGLSRVAGTDAHYAPQIGVAYTVIDAEPTVDAVAQAILAGRCKPMGTSVPVVVNVQQQLQRLHRMVAKFGKAPHEAI
jgi:predicted metal-dependent phosphoesterase TrpH